jgi:hypothetical protein
MCGANCTLQYRKGGHISGNPKERPIEYGQACTSQLYGGNDGDFTSLAWVNLHVGLIGCFGHQKNATYHGLTVVMLRVEADTSSLRPIMTRGSTSTFRGVIRYKSEGILLRNKFTLTKHLVSTKT